VSLYGTRALRNLRGGSNVMMTGWRRRWCHVPLEYSHRGNVYRLRCNGDERSGTTA
jgi:hypothetical protein